jgi:hypothetical protein
MVASDRASRQAAERAAAATKTGGDTEQFAKAVAANGDGWRKEPPAVAPTPPPTPTPVTLGQDHGLQSVSGSQAKGDPYLDQLRAKKLAFVRKRRGGKNPRAYHGYTPAKSAAGLFTRWDDALGNLSSSPS